VAIPVALTVFIKLLEATWWVLTKAVCGVAKAFATIGLDTRPLSVNTAIEKRMLFRYIYSFGGYIIYCIVARWNGCTYIS